MSEPATPPPKKIRWWPSNEFPMIAMNKHYLQVPWLSSDAVYWTTFLIAGMENIFWMLVWALLVLQCMLWVKLRTWN